MGELRSLGARLRALRLAKGLSQIELARAVGRHQTAIGPYERDEYTPPLEIIERFARVLDTTPEYLSFGRTTRRAEITVAGRIQPGGEIDAAAAAATPRALRADAALGYQVEDDSMAPVYRPGQIVLVARAATEPWTALIGRDAVVRLDDGRELLRRILPGPSPERALLQAYAAPALVGVAIVSARAVLGVLSAEALT